MMSSRASGRVPRVVDRRWGMGRHSGAAVNPPNHGRAVGHARTKPGWVAEAASAASPCAQNTHWHMATGSPRRATHDNNNTVAHRGWYQAGGSAVCVVKSSVALSGGRGRPVLLFLMQPRAMWSGVLCRRAAAPQGQPPHILQRAPHSSLL